MGTTSNTANNSSVTIKLNKKAVKSSATAITKELNNAKRELVKDRKGLKATIAYLCETDNEHANEFKKFFGISGKTNKAKRNEICAFIQSHYTHAKRVVISTFEYIDGNCILTDQFSQLIPTSTTGREMTDFLQVVTNIVKSAKQIQVKRSEVARQAWELRKKMIVVGTWESNENKELFKNQILRYAPEKHTTTTITETLYIAK